VSWPGGRDKLFTGFKPAVDPGYADFAMRAGETYRVELVSVAAAGPPAEVRLSDAGTLCPDLPDGKVPSWEVVFVQGVR
jgi:hypothetical protein